MCDGPGFGIGGLNVLTVVGDRIAEITSFLDPVMFTAFDVSPPPAS